MSSSLPHGTRRASVPQLQNQYQEPLLCGWSRDLEPYPVSLPSNLQSLSPTLPLSTYPNEYQHDAWMCHVLGGNVDTCASSLDADTTLSASGFLGALADYDYGFLLDAHVETQPPMTLTYNNVMSSAQSAPPPCNEPICGTDRQIRVFECQWIRNGSPCNANVMADRRSVVEHLQHIHDMKPGEEKFRQACFWEGCTRVLNKESLARHILTVHLKEKVQCAECRLSFAREDSLKRHLNGGHHKVFANKSAARQLSRNHAGLASRGRCQ